jgi:ribose transport system substrate-binding protein
MKTRILAIVLAIAMLLGCISAIAEGTKTIGVIYWSLNNNFMVFLKNNIEAECAALGYESIPLDSRSSTVTELSNVEDLISRNVDAVILVPMDSDASSNAVVLLNNANIPVITVDRSTTSGEVITSIATDNYAGGKTAGEFAVKQLEGKGKVVILRGTLGTDLENQRFTGFKDAIAETEIEVVSEQSANFDRTTAFNTIENILQAHPDIDLVYAENDEMCLGVAKALESANRSDIMVIGFDGAVETLEAIKAGKVTGTVFQQFALIGKLSVDIFDQYFKGDTASIENPMSIPCEFASFENIDHYLAE